MHRRIFTGVLLAAAWPARAQSDELALRLRLGACALLVRHAQTEPGIGDPPGFRLDRCDTQRNLSAQGRSQAERMGEWFQLHGLEPRAVRSSAWCRCKDTADLAFGHHAVWPALNSFFSQSSPGQGQTAQVLAALKGLPAGAFEVWVTHQVNMTALTGTGVQMGEALLLDAMGKMVGRRTFS